MESKDSNKDSKSQYSIFTRIVNLFLPLSMILVTYGYGTLNFSFCIAIILVLIWLIRNKGRINIQILPKTIIIYILYYVFIHYISLSSLVPIFAIRVLLFLLLFFNEIQWPLFYKYYKVVAKICITFFFIQFFIYNIFKIGISGVFSFLPISIVDESVNLSEEIASRDRFSSFFSEPAHFAQFLGPLLGVELFSGFHKTKKIPFPSVFTMLICLTLLMIFSGNALLILLIMGVIYVVCIFRRMKSMVSLVLSILLSLLVVVSCSYYISSTMGEKLLARQGQIKVDQSEADSRSGFIRIYRGYYIYDELPLIKKIIGDNNVKNIKKYIKKSDVSFMFGDNDIYMNGIQSFLIKTGIIGVLLFMMITFQLCKNNCIGGKSIAILFFFLSFIASLYFGFTMILYWVTSFKLKNYKRHK